MADEVIESQGTGDESQAGAVEAEAQAESAVADKMADIFGEHAGREQADEHAEDGVTSPDNPDGDEAVASKPTDAESDPEDGTVDIGDASVEDLRAAEQEAAQAGDYEKAIQLRNQIKAAEAAASQAKPGKVADDGVSPTLKALARDLGGWTDKDIADLAKANPTLARITFQKIADSYNNLSLQYAQAARNGAPQLQPQQAPQQNATTQQQTATLESLYKDLDKFSDVAGSEMVERFIKPLKSEVLEPLKDVINFVHQQRAEGVRREVLQGFEAVAKDGFENLYGKADSLTDAQRTLRQQVAQVADTIHSGAQVQRVDMSYGEAIRRAHLIVNADKLAAASRTQIVSQAKKRATQITSRPSNRVRVAPDKGEAAAMTNVSQFWAQRE